MKKTLFALAFFFAIIVPVSIYAQIPQVAPRQESPVCKLDPQALKDMEQRIQDLQAQVAGLEKKIDNLNTLLSPKTRNLP